jgi:hypothetical protein
MAAAAPARDFNSFLGRIAAPGTVNTDGNGCIAAKAFSYKFYRYHSYSTFQAMLSTAVPVVCDQNK